MIFFIVHENPAWPGQARAEEIIIHVYCVLFTFGYNPSLPVQR